MTVFTRRQFYEETITQNMSNAKTINNDKKGTLNEINI